MRGSICLLALAFLAGCVDQKKEAEQYHKVVRANLLGGQDTFIAGQPLTLRQALDLTNRQNERLAIEGENYLQSLIERKRAAANFMPTVTLAPSYSVRDKVATGGQNVGSSSQDSFLDVPVTGNMNVFNGFGDVARLKGAARTIEQRRNLLLDVQEAVLLEAARVYYEVLRSERSSEVLESSLKVQDARVRDMQGRRAAGTARPLDVAQTEAQASATRVLLINARSDVRNGRTTLAFLTAAPVAESPLVDQFNAPASLPTLGELEQMGQAQRRDLLAAQAAVLATRQDVDAAVAQYYPSVSLNLNVFLYRESIPDERKWDALLRANLPIFSAGLIEADVRDAWSRYRQAAMLESLLHRQVAQEIEIADQDLTTSGDRIAELEVQLRAAEQAFRQADQSYNIGFATNLERVTAQDQLLSAQLQLTSARFDRTLAYLSLARATGELRRRLETTPATMPTTQP